MPQITPTIQFAPKWDLTKFASMLKKLWIQLAKVVNHGISFGNPTSGADNISGVWTIFTTPVANTDFVITHNLGRIPVGYLVMTKSASVDIYTGSVPADETTITLRATVAGVVVTMFIL